MTNKEKTFADCDSFQPAEYHYYFQPIEENYHFQPTEDGKDDDDARNCSAKTLHKKLLKVNYF